MQCGSITARKFYQFSWFCRNFHKHSRWVVAKFPQNFTLFCEENSYKFKWFCEQNFHNSYAALIECCNKTLLCWKCSTKIALLEISNKNSLCLENTSKTHFFGTFPFFGVVTIQVFVQQNFHYTIFTIQESYIPEYYTLMTGHRSQVTRLSKIKFFCAIKILRLKFLPSKMLLRWHKKHVKLVNFVKLWQIHEISSSCFLFCFH